MSYNLSYIVNALMQNLRFAGAVKRWVVKTVPKTVPRRLQSTAHELFFPNIYEKLHS